jgi:hypothetical protein
MKRIAIVIISFLLVFLTAEDHFGQTISVSKVEDQSSVMVTVYNNNLGLVKDIRKVKLPPGTGELRFMDVASQIIPETVHVKSLGDPGGFSVLEQNYEYDLMNENKLLDKYVGQKIKLIDWNRYLDRKEEVEAILLSNNQGQIYRIKDEIYLGHPGYKVLPEIPENLISKPTLTWLYQNKSRKPQEVEVSYLTGNISWKADYVLVLNKDDTQLDLSGWVTIDNKSGAVYKDARLKLVAGEVHRIEKQELDRVFIEAKTTGVSAPQFMEREFFEYHIYDLQRKSTLKDKQTKQISLLEADGVKVAKELLVYGINSYFTRRYIDRNPKQPVNVYIKFLNTKDNNLGVPLPAGVMRLYKQDIDDSQQFIGEDRIEHTPKDEEIGLKVGKAFDVVAERIQTDYRQITSNRHESEWEITIRNRKNVDIKIGIIEPFYGHWKIINNSHAFIKKDAFTVRFDVEVPKDQEVKVTYRVQVGL